MNRGFAQSMAPAFVGSALGLIATPPGAGARGSFSLVSPLNQFRRFHTASLLPNGKVLVSGGTPLAQAATSELYDPATLSWTNSGMLNTARELHTATVLADGRVMVTGGQNASRILAATEIYDPAGGAWTNVGLLNEARESQTA